MFFCGDNGGADYFKDAEHRAGFMALTLTPGHKWSFVAAKEISTKVVCGFR